MGVVGRVCSCAARVGVSVSGGSVARVSVSCVVACVAMTCSSKAVMMVFPLYVKVSLDDISLESLTARKHHRIFEQLAADHADEMVRDIQIFDILSRILVELSLDSFAQLIKVDLILTQAGFLFHHNAQLFQGAALLLQKLDCIFIYLLLQADLLERFDFLCSRNHPFDLFDRVRLSLSEA